MAITPDTKDWTWSAVRRCDDCGYDPTGGQPDQIAPTLRRTADRWVRFLGEQCEWQRRPDPGTWSPIEYAAHVRDVIRLYDQRLRLMLETDDPLFANWDQDAAASGYLQEQPGALAEAIATDAEQLAGRSDGAQFTVESFGRYFLHDLIHHLHDVGG